MAGIQQELRHDDPVLAGLSLAGHDGHCSTEGQTEIPFHNPEEPLLQEGFSGFVPFSLSRDVDRTIPEDFLKKAELR